MKNITTYIMKFFSLNPLSYTQIVITLELLLINCYLRIFTIFDYKFVIIDLLYYYFL